MEHFLLALELIRLPLLQEEEQPIQLVHPNCLIDLTEFQRKLGISPEALVYASIEVLVTV